MPIRSPASPPDTTSPCTSSVPPRTRNPSRHIGTRPRARMDYGPRERRSGTCRTRSLDCRGCTCMTAAATGTRTCSWPPRCTLPATVRKGGNRRDRLGRRWLRSRRSTNPTRNDRCRRRSGRQSSYFRRRLPVAGARPDRRRSSSLSGRTRRSRFRTGRQANLRRRNRRKSPAEPPGRRDSPSSSPCCRYRSPSRSGTSAPPAATRMCH
jgi:hypothetical protein